MGIIVVMWFLFDLMYWCYLVFIVIILYKGFDCWEVYRSKFCINWGLIEEDFIVNFVLWVIDLLWDGF